MSDDPWQLATPASYVLGHVGVVLPDRVVDDGRVVVRDGIIAEVGQHPNGRSTAGRCCDAHGDGLHLLPGLVDVHSDTLGKEVHPRPGTSVPEEFALASTESRLRAAGITTAFHGLAYQSHSAVGLPISSPGADGLAPLVDAAAARPSAGGWPVVDHRVLHRVDVRSLEGRRLLEKRLLDLPAQRGTIPVVSHEDHTPGQGQYANPTVMQRWLERGEGMSPGEAAKHVTWWHDTREEQLDVRASTLAWLGNLAHAGSIRLFGHDPTTIDDIDALVERGGVVAEFPTTVTAAQRARDRGLHTVAGAPNIVRGGSHSGNVSAEELVAAGLVDALASDYLPTAMLPAAVSMARRNAVTLPRAVALVTSGPAATVGLRDRGRIGPGLRADLTLADLRTTACRLVWSGAGSATSR